MKKSTWFLVVVLLLVAFGMRMEKTAVLGIQADEGVHLVAAGRVAAGDVLYRDWFENRTPGVEWLLAAVFRVTGSHYFVGRVLTVLASALTVAGLIAAGKGALGQDAQRGLGVQAGLIAGFLFAIAPLPLFWSRYTMLEPFETAVATLSIACALNGLRTQEKRWWFAAMSLAGLAILSKQSGLVLLPLHAGLIGWLLIRRQFSLKQLLAWSAGMGIVLFLFMAVLLLQGAADDFLHLLSGVERLSPMVGLLEKMKVLGAWSWRQPAPALAVLGAVFLLWRRRLSTACILGWALIESAALFLPARLDLDWGGVSQYVLPAVAALSLLAGVGLMTGWQLAGRRRFGRIAWSLVVVGVGMVVWPGWVGDFDFALRQVGYPQPDIVVEQNIGRVLSLVSEENQPIVVLANGAFYHWANRPPAAKFFHVPGFLSDSYLAEEADDSLQAALRDAETGALLVSRMHLDRRLSTPVVDTMRQYWMPVHLFWYPYQQDVFLFMRRPRPSGQLPLATYDGGISLTAVHPQKLNDTSLLVQLEWMAHEPQTTNYTVFVHLLGPDGVLVAQSDAMPMAGFAPTTTWERETAVSDGHWLEYPDVDIADGYVLSIGLYQAETGQRLLLSDGADAFVVPLEE
ncbi:MAG: ArnT family glycosyltransferase [Anaerolineae bacterium]